MGDITVAMVKQFGANVDMLSQGKGSVLSGCVRLETGVVGEEAYFDQLASTAAVKKTTRNSDTPLIKSDHRRRRVTLYDYEWADLMDKQDKLKMLSDPTNKYAINAAWAMGRAKDDEIIDNFDATAYTGKAGGTSTAFRTANVIASTCTGLTLTKLLNAKELLDASDVDPDEERFCAYGAAQGTDLLNTTEIKSADYNSVKALVQGQINQFMGFTFKMTNRLNLNSSSERKVLAWAKNGMLLAVAADVTTEITKRADKSYATQVYVSMGIGATRMEEEKCVTIACEE